MWALYFEHAIIIIIAFELDHLRTLGHKLLKRTKLQTSELGRCDGHYTFKIPNTFQNPGPTRPRTQCLISLAGAAERRIPRSRPRNGGAVRALGVPALGMAFICADLVGRSRLRRSQTARLGCGDREVIICTDNGIESRQGLKISRCIGDRVKLASLVAWRPYRTSIEERWS